MNEQNGPVMETFRISGSQALLEGKPLPFITMPSPYKPPVEPVCQICKDMRFTHRDVAYGHPDFGKAFPCNCKKAMQKSCARGETFTWLGASQELAQALEKMTFETFQASYQSTAYHNAHSWAILASQDPTGQPNIVFTGNNGTGKTHLAAAILHKVREHAYTCLFTTASRLFQSLYAATYERQESIFNQASRADILCLDDLDKLHTREDSNYQKKKLFDIINERYIARKPTIITTNVFDDLNEWLTIDSLSRLSRSILVIRMEGEDYRPIEGRQDDLASASYWQR
ncbi:MAG TPA: ATP-binding protein [Ktedonobacteraceae bacterium]